MARAQPPPLIRKLLSPSAYPHPVSRVELLQTHISYVLLAGDYAYKIKKPVNFGFLDYSSLAKRRYYCQQEVILNRRFCHDTYLGVLAIREKAGRDAFSGSGKIIEYAVQMRRLPLEKRLDVILESGQASEGMLEAVAQELADSHARAATGPNITRSGERSIRRAWRENFQQWHAFIGRTITEEE
ncbi:MAG TPA: kinase, partial [Dehalococcoidia bacterium]|nr:kinase [Dehalococcoidia bacterium]